MSNSDFRENVYRVLAEGSVDFALRNYDRLESNEFLGLFGLGYGLFRTIEDFQGLQKCERYLCNKPMIKQEGVEALEISPIRENLQELVAYFEKNSFSDENIRHFLMEQMHIRYMSRDN